MRALHTAELTAVSGGTFGCFSWLLACKPQPVKCAPPAPKCEPAPKCDPKPKPEPKSKKHCR